MTTTVLDLDTLHLDKGGHKDRTNGLCIMEAVAWFAAEEHTDAPECVSRVLIGMGQRLNDLLPDDRRQQLKPLIPLLPGTRDDGHDETRGYLALDWLIRTYTPVWLDLAGLTTEAQALRDLRRIVDLAAVQSAGLVVREVRVKAAAAWDAAGAAWDAAWDAAGAAAGAARDAAWDAAGAAWAAGDAAGAARDAAWAAGDAAWAAGDAAGAARDAAGAARDAAWDAAGAAWDAGAAAWAAGDAARDKLQPTVDTLQESAIELYRVMVRVGRDVSV